MLVLSAFTLLACALGLATGAPTGDVASSRAGAIKLVGQPGQRPTTTTTPEVAVKVARRSTTTIKKAVVTTKKCASISYLAANGTCIRCNRLDRKAMTCNIRGALTCSSGYEVHNRKCVLKKATTTTRTTTTSAGNSRAPRTSSTTTTTTKATTTTKTTIKTTTKPTTKTTTTSTKSTTTTRPKTTTTTTKASTTTDRVLVGETPTSTTTTTTATTTTTTMSTTTTTTTMSTTTTATTTTKPTTKPTTNTTTTTTTKASTTTTTKPTTTTTTTTTTIKASTTTTTVSPATVLASGYQAQQSGLAGGKLPGGISWQASGYFAIGGCPSNVAITTCYSMALESTGNLAITRRGLEDESYAEDLVQEREEEYDEAEAMPMWAGGPVDVEAGKLFARADAPTNATTTTTSTTTNPNSATTTTTTTTTSTTPTTTTKPTTTTTTTKPTTTTTKMTTSTTKSSTTTTTSTSPTATPTPRQRIELYSNVFGVAGSSYKYTWRTYITPDTTVGRSFFHVWQLLRRDATGGAVMTLDGKSSNAMILDSLRTCGNSCGSIPWSSYVGRTIQHTVDVTFGAAGKMHYVMTDAVTGATLLTYDATGQMGDQASIKFGLYRAMVSGLSPATAYVGDFTQVKTS